MLSVTIIFFAETYSFVNIIMSILYMHERRNSVSSHCSRLFTIRNVFSVYSFSVRIWYHGNLIPLSTTPFLPVKNTVTIVKENSTNYSYSPLSVVWFSSMIQSDESIILNKCFIIFCSIIFSNTFLNFWKQNKQIESYPILEDHQKTSNLVDSVMWIRKSLGFIMTECALSSRL